METFVYKDNEVYVQVLSANHLEVNCQQLTAEKQPRYVDGEKGFDYQVNGPDAEKFLGISSFTIYKYMQRKVLVPIAVNEGLKRKQKIFWLTDLIAFKYGKRIKLVQEFQTN